MVKLLLKSAAPVDDKTAHIDVECSVDLLFRYGAKRRHLVPYAYIYHDTISY